MSSLIQLKFSFFENVDKPQFIENKTTGSNTNNTLNHKLEKKAKNIDHKWIRTDRTKQ